MTDELGGCNSPSGIAAAAAQLMLHTTSYMLLTAVMLYTSASAQKSRHSSTTTLNREMKMLYQQADGMSAAAMLFSDPACAVTNKAGAMLTEGHYVYSSIFWFPPLSSCPAKGCLASADLVHMHLARLANVFTTLSGCVSLA